MATQGTVHSSHLMLHISIQHDYDEKYNWMLRFTLRHFVFLTTSQPNHYGYKMRKIVFLIHKTTNSNAASIPRKNNNTNKLKYFNLFTLLTDELLILDAILLNQFHCYH